MSVQRVNSSRHCRNAMSSVALSAVFLVGAASVDARPAVQRPEDLEIQSGVVAVQVLASDLVSGAHARSMTDLAAIDTFGPVILQDVVLTWRQVLPETMAPSSVDLTLDLLSDAGTTQRLSSAGIDGELPARFRAETPRLVTRDGDLATFECRATLELDIRELRVSGTYTGILRLTAY